MFKNQAILITGGTGSWGQTLTGMLLQQNPKEIRIFSRNEATQVTMQRAFNQDPRLKFLLGDVSEYQAVMNACRDIDYVFHLAALKHIPICEIRPDEALKTNVTGTQHVIWASIQNGVRKVIDISTDKAVDPINFYGLTKSIGEKLILQANNLSKSTRFVCIRPGNVLGTKGSVVPLFKEQILEKREITLTSEEMTRFFITVTEATDLLLKATQASVGGETFVFKMKACLIKDLAQVMADRLSNIPIRMRIIGIRPGEKLHEILVSSYESPYTYEFGDDYYVIIPSHASKDLLNQYKHLPKVTFERYDSSSNLMSYTEIEKKLKQGRVLD